MNVTEEQFEAAKKEFLREKAVDDGPNYEADTEEDHNTKRY